MVGPKEIIPSGDREMKVVWEDGVETFYSFRTLRKHCPCATCQEMRGRTDAIQKVDDHYTLRLIPQDSPGDDPVLTQVDWVGNYALRLVWQDGHDTGIYPYALLRELQNEG